MPPQLDIHQKVRQILGSLQSMPVEADSPILHFRKTSSDLTQTLEYLKRKVDEAPSNPGAAERHLERTRQMTLVNLIENLERFLKELAAACVDALVPVTADDRL